MKSSELFQILYSLLNFEVFYLSHHKKANPWRCNVSKPFCHTTLERESWGKKTLLRGQLFKISQVGVCFVFFLVWFGLSWGFFWSFGFFFSLSLFFGVFLGIVEVGFFVCSVVIVLVGWLLGWLVGFLSQNCRITLELGYRIY